MATFKEKRNCLNRYAARFLIDNKTQQKKPLRFFYKLHFPSFFTTAKRIEIRVLILYDVQQNIYRYLKSFSNIIVWYLILLDRYSKWILRTNLPASIMD